MLKGKDLKEFLKCYRVHFGTDINVGTKITVLSVFDFKAFLNIAMLLSESEKARALRQFMLDIVIDLIHRRTGGGTKFINKRDKDFVLSRMSKDINDRVDILKNKQRIPYSVARSKDLAISNCGGGRCNGKTNSKNDVCL